MSKLQDLINLAKADGGKFFVMDEAGDAKLVILPINEYQKLLLGKLQQKVVQQAEDIEKINKEIIKAQLTEKDTIEPVVETPFRKTVAPQVQSTRQVFPSRFQDLREEVIVKEEVIDTSFNFEGPKVEFEDF